ncbi:hypothetical protein [Cryobacterium sp. GrIS_2_6]|uniref:hypothetical protein n=1 Tax=Cryobacterium sp. GrIS_2_6 TaxID=3162785 RepID=UPI002E08DB3E|nr:hypothetical protein [Cryobacterium psychrotolerans]
MRLVTSAVPPAIFTVLVCSVRSRAPVARSGRRPAVGTEIAAAEAGRSPGADPVTRTERAVPRSAATGV